MVGLDLDLLAHKEVHHLYLVQEYLFLLLVVDMVLLPLMVAPQQAEEVDLAVVVLLMFQELHQAVEVELLVKELTALLQLILPLLMDLVLAVVQDKQDKLEVVQLAVQAVTAYLHLLLVQLQLEVVVAVVLATLDLVVLVDQAVRVVAVLAQQAVEVMA
jgi:hypothetical protein